jgi:hypothetical protein
MEYINDPESQRYDDSTDSKKTPTGLVVLCILTFIGSGFSALAYLMLFFMYDSLPEMMMAMGASMGGQLSEYYANIANTFSQTPKYLFLLITISRLFSIAGGVCMIKMRKLGFHLYVTGQILLLGLPMLIMKSGFSVLEILIAFVFIALYGSYLKKMK